MSNKHKKTLIPLVFLILAAFSFSFAAVPLYSLFCKVTGYGGTTKRVAKSVEQKIGLKKIEVFFNGDVAKDLEWEFKPLQRKIKTVTGKRNLIFFKAKNLSNKSVAGTASFNVTPLKAGSYFSKIECFCFTKQILAAKEEMIFPVSFYIDSAIENDPYLKDVNQITLSYSFFLSPK